MGRKLQIVYAALMLSGCAQYVENWELDRATEFCAEKDGVDKLWVDAVFDQVRVHCNDGGSALLTKQI